MFSPDSFYDYLRYYLHHNKKLTILRNFETHGSLNLFNINNNNTSNAISPYIINDNNDAAPFKYKGYCEMFDQEPIDLYYIMKESSKNENRQKYLDNLPELYMKETAIEYFNYQNSITDPLEYISKFSSAVHLPIICHSEKNSKAVFELKNNNFIPIHYWYHAYISLYWFQHYKLLHINPNLTNHRFGLYARDASGTRKYRLDILNHLYKINKNVYFTPHEPIITQGNISPNMWNTTNVSKISSNSSASITWTDIYRFDIQLVAETLFNTEKVHLSEKVFKPIIMGQPFILFAGPLSLQYIKDYGFETYSSLWDESYDLELDNDKRFSKLISLILYINTLPLDEYNTIIKKAKKIAQFNRTHFYSNQFSDSLHTELHNSIEYGCKCQEEMFFKKPGGTWFSILDDHYKSKFHMISPLNTARCQVLVRYINKLYPKIAKQIIKKYNHLL